MTIKICIYVFCRNKFSVQSIRHIKQSDVLFNVYKHFCFAKKAFLTFSYNTVAKVYYVYNFKNKNIASDGFF